MKVGVEALPDDVEALKAALIVARAEAAAARAQQSDDQALIAHLKLQIEKLNRDRYGPRSERTARLLDQLELRLEELEISATEDELAAEMAAAKTTKVASFTRKRPSRQPFPEHLPRERVIVPGPMACACCGSSRPAKPAGDGPVREVWPASAAQPPGRALCQGGRADQSVDLGRPGRRLHGGADAVVQAPRGLRAERRAIAWGRHHGPGAGQGQDRHRPNMGLRARRQAFS